MRSLFMNSLLSFRIRFHKVPIVCLFQLSVLLERFESCYPFLVFFPSFGKEDKLFVLEEERETILRIFWRFTRDLRILVDQKEICKFIKLLWASTRLISIRKNTISIAEPEVPVGKVAGEKRLHSAILAFLLVKVAIHVRVVSLYSLH